MFSLYPTFDDKIIQLKHNTLVSYALTQILVFFVVIIISINGSIDKRILPISFITTFLIPLLVIIFARKKYYLLSGLFIGLIFISSLAYIFIIKGFDNSYYGIFIVLIFVITTLCAMSLDWKIAILLLVIYFMSLFLDNYFEKFNILNFINGDPILKIYYISILALNLFSILVTGITYSVTHTHLFNKYYHELKQRETYENELLDKNLSLNELNSELEEHMALLEESNERINYALKKAEESDRLKTSFLQNISHEVRTPLNAIVGFLNILKDRNYKYNCKQDELIAPTINASYQLLNIITDIIELSHLDAGTAVIESHDFNFNNVISEISAKTKDECEGKGLDFILDNQIKKDEAIIRSDKWRIAQIVKSLLSNAVKFTFKGNVKLTCKITNEELILVISDTGIGIKKEELKDIFKRFKRIETESSQLFGGLGIGLTIAKELTLRLNGIINVESEYGKGTEFRVVIPYEKTTFKNENIKVMSEDSEIKVKKILIAEDDVSNFKFLEMLLSKYEDIAIFHAWNGQEAIDIFKSEKDIDAVLMDIKMPVMDGIKAFEEIKEINPKVPIFAVTAYALDHEKDKLLAYGFDGYLTKPVKKGEILGLLELTSGF